MKTLQNFILESNGGDKYQKYLTKEAHERIDIIKDKFKNVKELSSFFNNIKKYKGSENQNPMRNDSVFVGFGAYHPIAEGCFYYYDNIFIQFDSPKNKFAIYLDKDSSKIAICKNMHISYSGAKKDKASFLQEDGTYGSESTEITWLDPSSESVQKELEKF